MTEPTESPAYFRPPPRDRPYGAPFDAPAVTADGTDGTAPTPSSVAGPVRRLVARIVDVVIVGLIASPATVPLMGSYLRYTSDAAASGISTNVYDQRSLRLLTGIVLVSLVVSFLYEVPQLVRWGQTVGKRLCRIRVVPRAGGAGLSARTAATRWVISGAAPAIPYVGTLFALVDGLWLLWDPWRQCLHDKAVATIVLKVPR